MQQCCEVCEGFRPGVRFGGSYRVVAMDFDVRRVHLCVGHARIAENSGVTSFEELRELYGEGRRSFVPRRDPQAEPLRPRIGSPGRRKTDLTPAPRP